MANDDTFGSNRYLRAFDPANPTGNRFDYEAFLGDIGSMAESTRQVTEPELPKLSYMGDPRMQAAFAQYQGSREVLGKQAEKAATALEMRGGAAAASMHRLGQVETEARGSMNLASEGWTEAGKKAGEYVGASRQRTKSVLADLERINTSIGKERDFAKAHAMQAGVQAVLGSVETEGRAIAEQFGKGSKEYQEFEAKKNYSLATLNSNIYVNYQQMAEAQGQNYLNTRAGAAERMAMYENFQEQQHVETLQAMATSTAMYSLQTSQFILNIEQLRIAGMDDIANWIVGTPEFSMDVQPLISLMADIGAEKEANRRAREAEKLARYIPPSREAHLASRGVYPGAIMTGSEYGRALATMPLGAV